MNEFEPWLDLANTLSNSHERVKFQRDELLAVLKEWAATYNSQEIARGDWPLMDRTRAAIARVEEVGVAAGADHE